MCALIFCYYAVLAPEFAQNVTRKMIDTADFCLLGGHARTACPWRLLAEDSAVHPLDYAAGVAVREVTVALDHAELFMPQRFSNL